MADNLEYFMHPKAIAIVGASMNPDAVGYSIVSNLVDINYSGKIFPVNPNLNEVLGLKAYPDITRIPEPVDLVMIAIQPLRIPDVIGECGEKGIKGVIIASPGFSDTGEEGRKLERSVVKAAKEYGISIIGPNTQGLININGNSIVLTLRYRLELQDFNGVSYICQTGLFYWDWISRCSHLGLSKAVDLGNMCDVDHAQLLEYLMDDPDTRVIALHIEGIQDGRQFMETACKVTKKKPVIALKAGRTEKGARVIASHTGSMVGDDMVYGAAFRQAGITRAMDMDELADFTKTFACFSSLPAGNRVAVVTFSGSGGSLAADACEEFGLELVDLSDHTIERLRKIFPPWATVGNPIDVLQLIKIEEMRVAYAGALESLSEDPNVNAIAVITIIGNALTEFDVLDILLEHSDKTPKKPTVVVPLRLNDGFERATRLELKGVPVFPTVRRGIKAIAVAHERYRYLHP